MRLDDQRINRARFDSRTPGKWRGESLEVLACDKCGQVFIGVPDCHALLVDDFAPTEFSIRRGAG